MPAVLRRPSPCHLVLAGLLAGLTGCSALPQLELPGRQPDAGGITERPASDAKARLKPMPLRSLSLNTQCSFRDETGNFGKATVNIANSRVDALKVELTMPKRGSCRYDLASFRQTQALPSIELTGPRNCRIHIWEQAEQITVAFADCHQMCAPSSAHDYVWPLLIDKATGQCD